MSSEANSSMASSSTASMDDDDQSYTVGKWKLEILEEFAGKLVEYDQLVDDPCDIVELNDYDLYNQLRKLGVTSVDDIAKFENDVFVSACQYGCTKALSAIVAKLKQTHGSKYHIEVRKYLSALKDVGELGQSIAIPDGLVSKFNALTFCLAFGFLPGLKILVEEAIPKEDLPYYLTFFDTPQVLDKFRNKEPFSGVDFRNQNTVMWQTSPLVYSINQGKRKCTMYALQNGAIPYWSWTSFGDTNRGRQEYGIALYHIIQKGETFLFDQVMGRKFPVLTFDGRPFETDIVIPWSHRNTWLIEDTMRISDLTNEENDRESTAIEDIERKIAELRRERDTAIIALHQSRKRNFDDNPLGEMTDEQKAWVARVRKEIDNAKKDLDKLESQKTQIEREFADLRKSKKETCGYMALKMVERSGPWDYYPETDDDGENYIKKDGTTISRDDPYAEEEIDVTLTTEGVDYTDAYGIAWVAAVYGIESVFMHLVAKGRFPLFTIDESDLDQAPYRPTGTRLLLDAVFQGGTRAMAELLMLEDEMNPFGENFDRVYESVFGDSLENIVDFETDYENINLEFLPVFVKFFLKAAIEEGRRGEPIVKLAPMGDVKKNLVDNRFFILHLAVVSDEPSLVTAAVAAGDSVLSYDYLNLAAMLDKPNSFYTLLGLGATITPDIMANAQRATKLRRRLISQPIIQPSSLHAIALGEILKLTPQKREEAYRQYLISTKAVEMHSMPQLLLQPAPDPNRPFPEYAKKKRKKRTRAQRSPTSDSKTAPSRAVAASSSSSSSSSIRSQIQEPSAKKQAEQIRSILMACKTGNSHKIKSLLQENPSLAGVRLRDGTTLTAYAIQNKQTHLVPLLKK